MKKRIAKQIFSLLLMILFVAACAAPPAPTTTEPQATLPAASPQATGTDTATEAPATAEGTGVPVTGEGLCANAYYPIREGATWTYQSAGGNTGGYSFTDTITSARDDGFTLSTQIAGLTQTQEWNCTSEGLVALQFGGAPAAMLTSQAMQLGLQVNNVTGITFPKNIQPADQWSHSLDFEGNVTLSGNQANATGNAQTSFNAIGMESVTVPAGTFDAMKIQADTVLDMNASYAGLSVPVSFSATYTYWFVQGVGWVKASGTGSLAGKSFSETIELQSYNIP